jgi:hypothetical protein
LFQHRELFRIYEKIVLYKVIQDLDEFVAKCFIVQIWKGLGKIELISSEASSVI